jgi:GTP-binding protein
MNDRTPLPIVAIVGRPNVGKSTLFNRILGQRKAVVLDTPGVTRDRNYAIAEHGDRAFLLVDTGGFMPDETAGLTSLVREQCLLAIEEADVIVFVADLRETDNPVDEEIAALLRRTGKPVFLAVNKCDGARQETAAAEFYRFGLEPLLAVSAAHNRGIHDLLEGVTGAFPPAPAGEPAEGDTLRIAVVGRQNVGKSTLVNRLLGAPRVIADDVPGTTRDAIDTPFERGGKRYVLIDTAGIRRRGKIERGVERLAVTSAIVSLERCDVALIVVDGAAGVVDQDTHIAGYALEAGRACLLLVNKWDLVEKDSKTADRYTDYVRQRLPFLAFAPVLFVSAKSGKRVDRILDAVEEVMPQFRARFETSALNQALKESIARHSPPVMKGRTLKIKYAVQTRTAPPTFTLFVNDPDLVHFSYERYLANRLRERFGLTQVPLRLRFRRK